jgi:hypothetical protein
MATPVSNRVQKRRDALRAAGLRPVQLWVPDTRQASFAAECHRQSLLLTNDQSERVHQAWIEQAADVSGWE